MTADTVAPNPKPSRRATIEWLGLAALYLAGVVHWSMFLGFGQFSFKALDWPKEQLYLRVLRDATRDGAIPYHVHVPVEFAQQFPQFINLNPTEEAPLTPTRFLALPETILSPQVLLLRFMRESRFVLAHVLLLYTVGFLGLSWARYRLQLSLLPFATLSVLFNFNGYITSHLGVGHLMWAGYFLLPFFAVAVIEWERKPPDRTIPLVLSLVLAAMLYQGSLHLVVACGIFLTVIAACHPRRWRGWLAVVFLTGILASARLVPAAFAYWGFKRLPFFGGYPSLTGLLEALVVSRDASFRWNGGIFWWEYDAYIGVLGFAFLAYFGVYRAVAGRCSPARRFAGLDLPLVIMTLLSIGAWYDPIFHLPIPLVNSERVTSRFIAIPLTVLLFISASRMQDMESDTSFGVKGYVLFGLGLAEMLFSLTRHSALWTVETLSEPPSHIWHRQEFARNVAIDDPGYKLAWAIGLGLTVVGLVIWTSCWMLARTAKNTNSQA
jgi:hypothetical protein